jgi:photosystem II stability/assembly factor-like uncharacterized protein
MIVYTSPDGGSNWKPTPGDIHGVVADLWNIAGLSRPAPDVVLAYGCTKQATDGRFAAFLASSQDEGLNWSRIPLQWGRKNGENSFIAHAQFLDARIGWLVLEEVTYPSEGGLVLPTVTILGTTDGGTTWTEEWSRRMEPRQHQWFWTGHHIRISVSDRGQAFAFGVSGRVLRRDQCPNR